MANATVNLSLLSRGVGQIKHNGHEKIDVKLEPEDYFNYIGSDQHVYLPPVQPKYAFDGDTPRGTHEVVLPKTYTTRKGALLLFSEDYANRWSKNGAATDRGPRTMQHSLDDLDLKTVDDLGKSILAYGSHNTEGIHLRFTRDPLIPQRRFRPGFSAKRYLSRLTRSFDDTFLHKLLKEGYVHEKTLFVNNSLIPSLKRRINDDLSYLPTPYRIMKQMLMAPGILSGYTFYKGGSLDLDLLAEEDENVEDEIMSEPAPQRSPQIAIMDTRSGDERIVTYSDLDVNEKEQVLADLLVKSAINHALETQKESLLSAGNSVQSQPPSEQDLRLNMDEAVRVNVKLKSS